MTKRAILHLKPRRVRPELKDTNDSLADLLDQGSDLDPHNPHKLVQPSRAVIPDRDRLIEVIAILVKSATEGRDMPPRLADRLAHELSSLGRKIANAASGSAVDRE